MGELWTLGIVTCCVTLFVEEIETIEENIVEVFAVVVDVLVLFEEIRFVGVLVGGVSKLVENVGEDVPVEIAVGVVDMLLPVGVLWTLGIVTCCVTLFVAEIEGVAENFAEVVSILVDMLVLEKEIRLVDFMVGGVVEIEGVAENFVEVVSILVDMLVLEDEIRLVDFMVGGVLEIEGAAEKTLEVVAVVVDILTFEEEIRLNGVIVGFVVGGSGMLLENVDEGVLAEIVVNESVDIRVTVEELWTADVVLGDTSMLVDDVVVASVLKDCVVMWPQFSSQQNTLIS
ncbi:hypothetical protein DPX16_7907 [Anabarilius grahami]|uniref:Uncharacterized protein n=1 Tax=Anabarilius grahami TaxID=495550 RepID=A0A3N0Y8Z5_ANAGA|nr:hypothetical protein DPX16_7907 [Anabarilius grahami]